MRAKIKSSSGRFSLVLLLILLMFAVPLSVFLFHQGARLKDQARLTNISEKKSIQSQSPEAVMQNSSLNFVRQLSSSRKATEIEKSTPLFSQLLSLRKKAALSLIDKNPETFIRYSLSSQITSRLPKEMQALVEHSNTITGKIQIIHYDRIQRKKSFDKYFLTSSTGKTTQVYFLSQPKNGLSSGNTVEVSGLQLDDKLVTQPKLDNNNNDQNFKVLSAPPGSFGNSGKTPRNIAVILINFADKRIQPWTPEQISKWTFSDQNSIAAYYKENTFNKWLITGKVFGYYQLSSNSAGCPAFNWWPEIQKMASQKGDNLESFDNIIIAFPFIQDCIGAGWSEMPGRISFINGAYDGNHGVVSHELGHNFGVNHANFLSCLDSNNLSTPISPKCTSIDYGDQFDVMGSPYLARQMNAFHKAQLGALYRPENLLEVNSAGFYSLSPVESQSNTTPLVLKISRRKVPLGSVQDFFYVEYRQTKGIFDNFDKEDPVVKGVTIRTGTTQDQLNPPWQSQIIDSQIPDSTSKYPELSLPVGKSFEDLASGLKITTSAIKPDSATVNVEFNSPQCQIASPEISLIPAAQWAKPGELTYYNLRIDNRDSYACPEARFTLTPIVNSGWQALFSPGSEISSHPALTSYVYVILNTPSDSPSGFYDFSVKLTRPDSRASVTATANLNIYSP